MENLYPIPVFWDLIVLKYFYVFEIYVLIVVWFALYFFIKKFNLLNLLFVLISVFLYKYLTFYLFWNWCCWLQHVFYPSIWEVNILVWLLDVAAVIIWTLLVWWLWIGQNKRFISSVWVVYLLSLINEFVIRWLDLRHYINDINKLLSWFNIFWMPWESFIYILIWVIFILWVYDCLNKLFISWDLWKFNNDYKKYIWASLVTVLFMEILISPMFYNNWLPWFSYLYWNINWIMIIMYWVITWSVLYSIDVLLTNKKININLHEQLFLSVLVLFIIYLLVYSILFSTWTLTLWTNVNWFLWWMNIFGIPIEIIWVLIVMNLMNVMFIKRSLR